MSYLKRCGVKCFHWLIGVTIFVAWVLMIYIGYQILYPFKVVDVEQPFPVLNENHEVKRGGVLLYVVKYNKYLDVPAVNTRYIECADGNLVTLTSSTTGLPLGEREIVGKLVIPQKTSLGECVFVNKLDYEVNHFKTVKEVFKSEPFKVIE